MIVTDIGTCKIKKGIALWLYSKIKAKLKLDVCMIITKEYKICEKITK